MVAHTCNSLLYGTKSESPDDNWLLFHSVLAMAKGSESMHWSLGKTWALKFKKKRKKELQAYSDWMLLSRKQEEGWKQGVIGLESIFGFL